MSDLQPGRELDALVAVLMGDITGPVVEIVGGKAINAAGDSVILQPYSTDIAAAWLVAERVNKIAHESWKMQPLSLIAWGEDWNASFDVISSEEWDDEDGLAWFEHAQLPSSVVAARAKTAAHAICLAALKAVDVD